MYTVTEKELLSIVEMLKECRTILLGQPLKYIPTIKYYMWSLNTYRALLLRLILEEYGPDIEYMQGNNNIVIDKLSIFTIKWNQETTQESTYKNKIVSETNNIEELTEGISLIKLKLIDQYQQKDPILMDKYNMGTYNTGSFCWVINIDINLIKCRDKVVILLITQSHILYWYHIYLLHTEMNTMDVTIFHNLHQTSIRNAVRKEVKNMTLANAQNG